MAAYDALRISGLDHLEFAVSDLEKGAQLCQRLGFQKVAQRELRERQVRSYLMAQGGIRVLLSQSSLSRDPVAQFVKTHGDGVFSIAFLCEDAVSALEVAAGRGAEVVSAPRAYQREFGEVHQASIKAFGDVQHAFLSRKGDLFAEGFDGPCRPEVEGIGLTRIDEIALYLPAVERAKWSDFYRRVLGLSGETVLASPDGQVRLSLAEPVDAFLEINHGPGVGHVTLATGDAAAAQQALRRENVALGPPCAEGFDTHPLMGAFFLKIRSA